MRAQRELESGGAGARTSERSRFDLDLIESIPERRLGSISWSVLMGATILYVCTAQASDGYGLALWIGALIIGVLAIALLQLHSAAALLRDGRCLPVLMCGVGSALWVIALVLVRYGGNEGAALGIAACVVQAVAVAALPNAEERE